MNQEHISTSKGIKTLSTNHAPFTDEGTREELAQMMGLKFSDLSFDPMDWKHPTLQVTGVSWSGGQIHRYIIRNKDVRPVFQPYADEERPAQNLACFLSQEDFS